jgi:signal transduction histidine kinase
MMSGLIGAARRWLALAAILSALLLLESTLSHGPGLRPLHVLLGLATTLPLALAWKAPVAAGLAVQAAFALAPVIVMPSESLTQGLSVFFIATYVVAAGARSWWSAVGWGVVSLTLLTLQGLADPRYGDMGAVLANVSFGAMSWAVAAVVRVHAARSAAFRERADVAVRTSEAQALAAVQEERNRIAVELHDLVAHGLSVTLILARGARRYDDLHKIKVALRDIRAWTTSPNWCDASTPRASGPR